jgi:hypothetical protein
MNLRDKERRRAVRRIFVDTDLADQDYLIQGMVGVAIAASADPVSGCFSS